MALLALALLLQDIPEEIRRLGSDSLEVRSAAEEALVRAESEAVPRLVEAYPASRDPEVQARLRSALRRIGAAALDHLERHPVPGLETLPDEICADLIRQYEPKNHREELVIEYGPSPRLELRNLLVGLEMGVGLGRTQIARFTSARLGEAGLVVDQVEVGSRVTRIRRAVIDGAAGRRALRLILIASAMSLRREGPPGGWAGGGQVQVGARLREGDRELFRGAYWGHPGSAGQPAYAPLQAMNRILEDVLKGAAWEDRTLSPEFREDLRERAGWYLGKGREIGTYPPAPLFERMKDLLEPRDGLPDGEGGPPPKSAR